MHFNFYKFFETKVWFDQNSRTRRYEKNIKKINHINDVKNISIA